MSRLDITGKKFGRLTVICFSHIYNQRTYWKCECLCGNEIVVKGKYLMNGDTKSCGCLNDETRSINGKNNKKYNKFYIENNIVYIDLNNGEYMMCDIDDWTEENKYIKWFKNNSGYARGTMKDSKKLILFHTNLFKLQNKDEEIDHINGNRLDNRRCNLRIVTRCQNSKNKGIYSNNNSGTAGVSWNKNYKKWSAYIQVNKKQKILGYFDSIEDAIDVRKQAEIDVYGNYRRVE